MVEVSHQPWYLLVLFKVEKYCAKKEHIVRKIRALIAIAPRTELIPHTECKTFKQSVYSPQILRLLPNQTIMMCCKDLKLRNHRLILLDKS